MRKALRCLMIIKKAQRYAVAAGAIAVSLVARHSAFAALFIYLMKDSTR
ncbi:MAG: hypothetical protein ACJ8G3_16380 [Burkholderiaceae bacterium]